MPKTKKAKSQKKGGRPLFDGKDEKAVISKLKSAWDIGATDLEASLHADISISALKRYLEKNAEFRAERDRRKQKPILKARQTIYKDLGNPITAKWYLERKCKLEFATLNKSNNDVDEKVETLADALKKLKYKGE